MSHKRTTPHPRVTERTGTPKIAKGDDGKPVLLCPFCNPTHPLTTSDVSACGTFLQVRALQTIYKAKYFKEYVCIKCQQGGGEMVHFNNAFIHAHDCMPGVATFVDPPKFSIAAALVFRLPKGIKAYAEKHLGESKPVEEVDTNGTRTGKTLGYFFYKRSSPVDKPIGVKND